MRSNKHGLTLIEVILSIAILSVLVLIFLGIQTFSITSTRTAANSQELTRVSEAVIESATGVYLSNQTVITVGEVDELTKESGVDLITVDHERCQFTGGAIQCQNPAPSESDFKEIGIFFTVTAEADGNEATLYRFVRRP